MGNEHWFDGFSKTALRAATRREVARSVAVVLPSLLFGGLAEIVVAKNKRGNGGGNARDNKGKGNGKGPGKKPKKSKKPKPKPPKPPDASCSEGACHRDFVLQDNREWCEFICRQCDGDDPREFCIIDADPRDPSNPMKIAVCCAEGETCCDAFCCPEGHVCVDGIRCCRAGHTLCGGSCCGTDNPYTTCCDGTCVITERHQENCGACGNPCAAGEVCRLGQCECIDQCEEDECLNCPPGQFCHDGIHCSCGNGFKYCPLGEACIHEEYVCCGDTQSIIRYCFDGLHCYGTGVNVTCGHTPCS